MGFSGRLLVFLAAAVIGGSAGLTLVGPAPAGAEPVPVAVSLLVTPSIGCSPTENLRIGNGKITPV